MTDKTPADRHIGKILAGNYRIKRKIGEGGMSTVYLGKDILLHMPVAIKCFQERSGGDRDALLRFLREARTQAKLVHQNIVGIRAVIEEDRDLFIVMEYVQGHSLEEVLQKQCETGKFSLDMLRVLFKQILDGVSYAHDHGVIHRDLKPSNILVSTQGEIKIADFGIARELEGDKITRTGLMIGTPAYMSPEQVDCRPLDLRSDIYSLGITFYEMLSGLLPFYDPRSAVPSLFEQMRRHISAEPNPLVLLDGEKHPALEAVLQRSLEKEPEDRFASCQEFAEALESAFEGKTPAQQELSDSHEALLHASLDEDFLQLPPAPVHLLPLASPSSPTPTAPLGSPKPNAQTKHTLGGTVSHRTTDIPLTSEQDPSARSRSRAVWVLWLGLMLCFVGMTWWVNSTQPSSQRREAGSAINPGQGLAPRTRRRLPNFRPATKVASARAGKRELPDKAAQYREASPSAFGERWSIRQRPKVRKRRRFRRPTGRTKNMVLVRKGCFIQGLKTPLPDKKATKVKLASHAPPRKVCLSSFWIDRFEVTVGEYRECVEAKGCKKIVKRSLFKTINRLDPIPAYQPVRWATWWHATRYCRWAKKRLPTEAEWEKAARGRRGNPYPWGKQAPSCDRASYRCGGKAKSRAHATGQQYRKSGRSPYGAYDMAGNVWEWVQDCYVEDAYAWLPTRNPLFAPKKCARRVLRGGSWRSTASSLRSYLRRSSKAGRVRNDFGFRCAWSKKRPRPTKKRPKSQ